MFLSMSSAAMITLICIKNRDRKSKLHQLPTFKHEFILLHKANSLAASYHEP